ncbi:MAG: hypothetical protein IJD23_07640 [Spirochaetaceae bacterium]|nr:hypothetical protein [Spirochaetaceae bacterium]
MKTKTDYFTKFITFCVLSLFLVTNMILFTSCDNGNSPNDNTNEEQNNNAPTDYCEICDGVQDKNHQHDYCDECDGIQDKNHQHEQGGTENEDGTITETTYPDWFKETTIGGEDSPYKIMFPVESEYLGAVNSNTDPILQLNSYSDQFKKYIHDLSFSEDFKEKYNTDIAFKTFDNYSSSEESKLHYNKNFDYLIEQINDVCVPVFEEIIKNMKEDLDKKMLYQYYRAYTNEAEKYGYSTNFSGSVAETQYNAMKTTIKNTSFNKNYPIYETITKEDGTKEEVISKSASENLTSILTKAANEMSVDVTDLQKIFNLSLTTNTLNSVHNCTATQTEHTVNNCPSNTILDSVILPNISLNNYSTITPTSIHQDFGRELC